MYISDAEHRCLSDYPTLWKDWGPLGHGQPEEKLAEMVQNPQGFTNAASVTAQRWASSTTQVFDVRERQVMGHMMGFLDALCGHEDLDIEYLVSKGVMRRSATRTPHREALAALRQPLMHTLNLYIDQWFRPFAETIERLNMPQLQDNDPQTYAAIEKFAAEERALQPRESMAFIQEYAKLRLLLTCATERSGQTFNGFLSAYYEDIRRLARRTTTPLKTQASSLQRLASY